MVTGNGQRNRRHLTYHRPPHSRLNQAIERVVNVLILLCQIGQIIAQLWRVLHDHHAISLERITAACMADNKQHAANTADVFSQVLIELLELDLIGCQLTLCCRRYAGTRSAVLLGRALALGAARAAARAARLGRARVEFAQARQGVRHG